MSMYFRVHTPNPDPEQPDIWAWYDDDDIREYIQVLQDSLDAALDRQRS